MLTGCTKLDENPDSLLTTEQYYKSEGDALTAVNSIYNAALNNGGLTMYNRLLHVGMEIMTDDAIAGQRVTNIDVRAMASLTQSTTNDRVDEIWKESYTAIDRANIAIDRIPAIGMDEAKKARLINEAKFLRGLTYFNLVRLWGDVPLILHETKSLSKDDLQVSRAPVAEVYQQIIADLTSAESLPPAYTAANDKGRATAGAAKAILAKVYLTQEEWKKAADKSLEVINGPFGYDLFENFADVFNVATKNGKEHIFSAQCKGGNGLGNRLASSATPVGVPGVAAAGTDEPHASAYGLYTALDKRRDVTFFTSLVSPTTGRTVTFPPRFFKYFDPATITNPTESAKNIPVIRFAEILLIYAEALNEDQASPSTEAYAAINRVRRRAGLANLVNLDQNTFREAVYQERRLELMFEFQRWFDLVRTKRMVAALQAAGKTNAAEKHYLYPIPQRERDLNPKLTQNKGWE